MSQAENGYLAVLTAFLTHIWLRNKPPKSISTIFVCLFAISSLVACSTLPLSSSLSAKAYSMTRSYLFFFLSLVTSITLYRISPFHPLSRYPGPFLCKISKLRGAYVAYGGKLHLYYKKLHDEYGPIVRVGPNEISITQKELIPAVLGNPGMPKGPLFHGRLLTPRKDMELSYSLISPPNTQRHAQLRKPWNKAFAAGPMSDYADIAMQKSSELLHKLLKLSKASPDGSAHVDLAGWMNFFSFDFMGEMAFGKSFDLLRDGDKDNLWHGMQSALETAATTQHVPWIAAFVRAMPSAGVSVRKFGEFAVNQAKSRLSKTVEKRDLFYHLLNAAEGDSDPTAPNPTVLPLVVSNSTLAIIAGSDTTSTALSNIIYYLLVNPKFITRLRDEIDHEFPPLHGGEDDPMSNIDINKLATMKFLNAVINETLRLQPALPTNLQRQPAEGSGGQMLGNIFIPEGTAINIPPYCLHRDPRYFSPYPDEFWPDRWLIKGEKGINMQPRDIPGNYVLDPAAYIPFSAGPANCAGKQLALFELRYLTTMMLQKFDIAFEKGYDPRRWEDSLEDRHVLSKGQLPVILTPRSLSG